MKKNFFLLAYLVFTFVSCTKTDECINCNESQTIDSKSTDTSSLQERRLSTQGYLKYNNVMFKGSHNSYERRESIEEQLNYSNPIHQNNVLALEFDVWRNTPKNYNRTNIPSNTWVVNHWPHPGKRGRTLASYFSQLKNWHTKVKNHVPVMIKLDIKSSNGGYQNFHEQIDWYLSRFLGDDIIFSSREMFKDPNRSLRHNMLYNEAWPTIDQLRGKFIIVLTGNDSFIDQYSKFLHNRRTAFAMKKQNIGKTDDVSSGIWHANNTINNNPNYIFYNFSMSNIKDIKNRAGSKEFLKQMAKRGMITRVYSANNRDDWNLCKSLKISCISTDKIRNHDWARIDCCRILVKR